MTKPAAKAPDDMVSGSFCNKLFGPRYQRNNKRGGLKNLRCFPTCGAKHKERGFCGQPVLVSVKHAVPASRLICWAEFVRQDKPGNLAAGEVVSYARALTLERTRDEPTRPWIRGGRLVESSKDDMTVFELNREKRGWHYGWASNKHTCNANHLIQCYVFERQAPNSDTLICRAVIKSPSFMLFCRRRRRFTVPPTAPIAAPVKRGRTAVSASPKTEPSGAEKKRIVDLTKVGAAAPRGNVLATPELDVRWADQVNRATVGLGNFRAVHHQPKAIDPSVYGGVFKDEHPPPPMVLFDRLMVRFSRLVTRLQSFPRKELDKLASTGGDWVKNLCEALEFASRRELDGVAVDRSFTAIAKQVAQDKHVQTMVHHVLERQNRRLSVQEAYYLVVNQQVQNYLRQRPSRFMDTVQPMLEAPFFNGPHGQPSSGARPLIDDRQNHEGLHRAHSFPLLGAHSQYDDIPFVGEITAAGSSSGHLPRARSSPSLLPRRNDDIAGSLNASFEAAAGEPAGFKVYSPHIKRETAPQMAELPPLHLDGEEDKVFDLAATGGEMDHKAFPFLFDDFGIMDGLPDLEDEEEKKEQVQDTTDQRVDNATKRHPIELLGGDTNEGSSELATTPAFGSHERSGSLDESSVTSMVSISDSIGTFESDDVQSPLYLTGSQSGLKIPNISGHWKRTLDSERRMQEMRSKSGTPWVLSKMFEFMESKFEIEQHGTELLCRFKRKILQGGTLRFVLDGEEHPWGIPVPFFQMSQKLTYRAWVDDNSIVLTHIVNDQRLTRINWVNEDRSILHSTVILEVYDAENGRFSEIMRCSQEAIRDRQVMDNNAHAGSSSLMSSFFLSA